MQIGNLLVQTWQGGLFVHHCRIIWTRVATVHCVIEEVCEAIVKNLWMESVQKHFPANEQEFTEAMVEMAALWQFPCCWGAVDGCHIPIQCPPGGAQASKEYHNFKNFFCCYDGSC